MRLDVLALSLALFALLAWKYRTDQRREHAWRAGLLDAVVACLPGADKSLDAAGFPRLRAPLPQGHLVEIGMLPDSAGYRRLPSLWLTVTLRAPIPDAPRLDLLARAQNVEFYSPGSELPFHCAPPEGWPAGLQTKCDRDRVDLAPLREQAAAFFADPTAKELMLAPAGVRLVCQLAQARRSEYLVLRTAMFDTAGADAQRVLGLVKRALAVREAWVAQPAALEHAA